MNLLIFGPAGAGKGTQSALLVEKMSMRHISTGDLFRYAMKNKTSLGVEAQKFIDKGELVPDSITIGMVGEELEKLGGKHFILDGFPRNVTQAEALENLLKLHQLHIGKAIFLAVPNAELVGRMTGRRLCKSCGAVYHIEFHKPKTEGICDNCGSKELYQREDDQEEAIQKRLDIYEETTKPLKGFYEQQGKLEELSGTGSSEDVFARIEKVLKA